MKHSIRHYRVFAALFAVISSPALAELPPSVRDMVEAAIATGDQEKVDIVIGIARQTNPSEAEELDALEASFKQRQALLVAKKEEAEKKAIRSAGLFQRWSGSGEIGAFRSSGNSNDIGATVAIALKRDGIDWEHDLTAKADFQRSDGVTTREQFLFAYQPRYHISQNVFSYALGQFERDRIQGFTSRISASAGLGVKLFDREHLKLSVEAGPAWRRTDYLLEPTTSTLAGRIGSKLNWKFSHKLALVEEASAYLESGNTTLTSLTGLEAGINDSLKARLSYLVEYDSEPGIDSVSTDTLSRVTLIYGF